MIKEKLTLKDFVKHQIPYDQLSGHNITIPAHYSSYYNGTIYIMENEVSVTNLFLDDLERESKYDYFFVFRKDVHVQNALVQKETESGPVVTFQGNVSARNIWTGGGDITFARDVKVEQTFIGVYNHGTVSVGGTLAAQVVISSGHEIYAPDIKNAYIIGRHFGDNALQLSAEDILKSKYYDKWDEALNEDNILKAIIKGESIVSDKSIQTPLQKRFAKMQGGKGGKLDLSYLELEAIPQEVWQMEEIKELNISGNNISCLPDEILHLPNLRKLNIGHCDFEQLPETVCRLEALEELHCGRNAFATLPESLSALQSLKKISLNECRFGTVPEVLYSLAQLSELDLSYQDTRTSLCIERPMAKLKKLNLSGNTQPDIRVALPRLAELNLSNCKLNTIPAAVWQMKSLSVLNIMGSLLSASPGEVGALPLLKDYGFDLSILDEEGVRALKNLPKLTTIRLNIDNTTSADLEQLLEIDTWSKLYTNEPIEDMFTGKKILERPNLKMLEMKGEKMDIAEARAMLGIR